MRTKTLLLSMIVMIVACTQSTIYHHYEPIDDNGWSRTDTIQYELPTVPEDGDYHISLGLRYNELFPYQGLWIVAETSLHHPTASYLDTLYFRTTDEDGRPTGKGLSLVQADTLLTTLHMPKGQKGQVCLRHIMIREVLPGIKDIGVKLEVKK